MTALEEIFRKAAEAAKSRPALVHTHSEICTFEVCLVGPKRDDLVRQTLERKARNGERLEHYSAASILAGLPVALVHGKEREQRDQHLTKSTAHGADRGDARAR